MTNLSAERGCMTELKVGRTFGDDKGGYSCPALPSEPMETWKEC